MIRRARLPEILSLTGRGPRRSAMPGALWPVADVAAAVDWRTLGTRYWHLSANDVDLDAASVIAMFDQCGSGIDAVEVSAARDPQYAATGGVGGGPGVVFTAASSHYMHLTNMSGAHPATFTVVAAIKTATTTPTQTIYSPLAFTVNPVNNPGSVGAYDGTGWKNCGTPTTGDQILSWTFAAAGVFRTMRNGSALATGSWDGTVGTINNPTLGAYYLYSFPLDATVSEVVCYDGALSADDEALVHAGLAADWGL